MTHLETKANEESAYTITVSCDFTPTAMKWSLTDEDGTVINSRSSVAVAVPSTSNTVTITGDDLEITNERKTLRIFTVYGTYNGGANKFADECTFYVADLKGVS
jgi:hypothetical protein